jgi:hypothetical protein
MSGPKTLSEAIALGMATGPLKDMHSNVQKHVKAFIVDAFRAQMVMSSCIENERLARLLFEIVRERHETST